MIFEVCTMWQNGFVFSKQVNFMLEQIDYMWCKYLWQTLFQTFFHVFHQNLNKKTPLLSYKSYWKYLLSSKIPKCNATQIFLAFFPRRKKKKYGMCFCTWHFLQFSSHLAQSGVGCLWPPPSTSTFTDNYTTTQAKGHTKLLRILIQYTYTPSLEYGQ